VLGASYRAGVKEVAYSGAYGLVQELSRAGAVTEIYDPIFSSTELIERGFTPVDREKLDHEIIIIQNEDASFVSICESESISPNAKVIYDGRNILPKPFKRAGVNVISLGR